MILVGGGELNICVIVYYHTFLVVTLDELVLLWQADWGLEATVEDLLIYWTLETTGYWTYQNWQQY